MITAAALAVTGAWLGFANPLFQLPALVLLLPAGLTLIGLSSATPGRAFKQGWITTGLAFTLCLYWIVVPVNRYGGLPLFLALPCPVLLGAYLGLYPALFTLALQWASRRLPPSLAGLLAGLIWFCLEFARGHLFSGLPWLVLSQAFAPWPAAIQSAGLVGSYGLSGMVCALSVWTVLGFRSAKTFFLPCCLLLGLAGFGWWQTGQPVPETRELSVGTVQANIDQSLKWDEAYQAFTVDRYLELSRNMTRQRPVDLLVWPETALPFYFQDLGEQAGRIHSFLREQGLLLVTGSPAYSVDPQGGFEIYNRAYLVGGQGRILGHYDKEHLVPFGEYVPFSPYIPFARKLVAGVGDFSPGDNDTPLADDGVRIGMLICYEAIFPELAQKRVAQGANLLVNISNDAWFGDTSAPLQHLHLSVLRAVEQNRFVVRATNTGISALIDPKGRITHQSRLFQSGTLYASEVALIEERTFFSRHGRTVTVSLFAATALLLAIAARRTVTARP